MKNFLRLLVPCLACLWATQAEVRADALGPPQISYIKFQWKGDVKEAHQHALNVLNGAGYRVPGDQNIIYGCYGTLPKDSISSKLFANILCSPVKYGEANHCNVIIITAGDDRVQVAAESEKLHKTMRNQGNADHEVSGSLVQGDSFSAPHGVFPTATLQPGPSGEPLIYAVDLHTVYGGNQGSATLAGYRILDEMDFNPSPINLSHPAQVQAAGKIPDNVAAVVVTTANESKPVQVHAYIAIRYFVDPKFLKDPKQYHNNLVAAKNAAKDKAVRYAADICHVLMKDPGNAIPPSKEKE